MIMWVLGPKEESLATVAGIGALILLVAGLRGLVRVRSWGVVSLGGAAAVAGGMAVASALFGATCHGMAAGAASAGVAGIMSLAAAPLAIVFLFAAVVPFVRPVARYLRS
jgi:hypothetical protein